MLGAAAVGVAVEDAGKGAGDLDLGCEITRTRVDLGDIGGEDEVGAGFGSEAQIVLLVTRVATEVLAGAELGRVDEEAHHHQVAFGVGGVDQREVALVQVAHRRHQADRLAGAAGVGEGRAKLGLGAQGGGGHGGTRNISEKIRVHRSMPWGSRPATANYRRTSTTPL